MRVRRAYADGAFGQIHYRIARPDKDGGRTPVACLHMSPKSGRSFTRVLEALSADRIAMAPDYPGYGASDPAPPEPHVAIADYARAVWTAADAAGLQAVDLVGIHTGSLVAVECARQQPGRARRLALISAPIATPSELADFRAFFAPIPLDAAGARFKIMWERIAQFRGDDMTLEMMAQSFSDNLQGGEAYEWGHRAAFNYMETDFAAALRALPHRITVFNPSDELNAQTVRAAALLRPGAVIEKPNWGHGFLEARADELASELRAVFD